MADALREGGPIGGVTHGGGEHGKIGFASVLVDELPIIGEHSAGALDGLGGEPPVGVHAGTKPGDAGLAVEVGDRPTGIDVGDEQTSGVGTYVDDGDAHGRGWYWCLPPRGLGGSGGEGSPRRDRRGVAGPGAWWAGGVVAGAAR